MATVRIFRESFSARDCTEIVFEGNIKDSIKFFNNLLLSKGYNRKDITYMESGNRKIGNITSKDLIKLDV